jgi:5-methylcytosine-specific restriction enzyme subunit McrC
MSKILIRNVYHMLAYAFQTLQQKHYQKLALETFDHVIELLAAILQLGVASQIKRGLTRDYISTNEALHTVRGKIHVQHTIKTLGLQKKELVCEFDEFSENMYLNQILKTTCGLLIRRDELRLQRKQSLKKLMIFFQYVDVLNPEHIDWSRVRFHRNNDTYHMLIQICKMIIDNFLLTNTRGEHALASFFDEQAFHQLFERFVRNYYVTHFPQYRAHAKEITWNLSDGASKHLPAMRTDTTLQYRGKTVIIDTKYYGRTMQSSSLDDKQTFHSHNLYQIYTYVKNEDKYGTGNVSGILLYAKTKEQFTPNDQFTLAGNIFCVKTLDLNCEFISICHQLNHLLDGLLDENSSESVNLN